MVRLATPSGAHVTLQAGLNSRISATVNGAVSKDDDWYKMGQPFLRIHDATRTRVVGTLARGATEIAWTHNRLVGGTRYIQVVPGRFALSYNLSVELD